MTKLGDHLRNLAESLISRDQGLQFGPARWLVMARTEDNRSDFPSEARITPSIVVDFVATFDPSRRRVPIICAQGRNIPAHFTDTLPPVGEITALDRDRINLWGAARSIIDPVLGVPRLDLCVSSGYNDRSIGFLKASRETDGRPNLFHLALLGGEPPGVPNMPSLAEHGFGLDAEQRAALIEQRAILDPNRINAAELIGQAVGDLAREWAAMGGLEQHRQLGDELQHRATCQVAFREDDDLIEGALHMKPDDLSALLEGLRTGIEKLGAVADRLTASTPTDDTQGPVSDADRAEPSRSSDDSDLQRRVGVAAHRAVAFGLMPRQAAEEQARRALDGGATAVEVFTATVDEMARAQQGQVFREVRTSTGATINVNLAAQQFRVFSNPEMGVHERKLAVLSQAIDEVHRTHPGEDDVKARHLERAAQRILRLEVI